MQKSRNNKSKNAHGSDDDTQKRIQQIDIDIEKCLSELQQKRDNHKCFPLLLGDSNIDHAVVDRSFDNLRTEFKDCNGRLDVIVVSSGGDLHAAYNLSMLFRKYGYQELNFIIPRYAKSAATLLVCSGDQILMTPVAELGPLDPQITEFNPLEKRLEHFSPLSIEATLELIRDEFRRGSVELAKELIGRLQFPLTLGNFKKSLDIAEQYLVRLLESRMLKDNSLSDSIRVIAQKLIKGYADHAYCINADEAKSMGLRVVHLEGVELDLTWQIYKLAAEKDGLEEMLKKKQTKELR